MERTHHYVQGLNACWCDVNLSDYDVDLSDYDVDLSDLYVDLSEYKSTLRRLVR